MQIASQLCGLPFADAAPPGKHGGGAGEGARVRAFPLLTPSLQMLSLLHRGTTATSGQPGYMTVRIDAEQCPAADRDQSDETAPTAGGEMQTRPRLPCLAHATAGSQPQICEAQRNEGEPSPANACAVVESTDEQTPATDAPKRGGGGSLWAALHSTAAQSTPRARNDCGTSPRTLHLRSDEVSVAAAGRSDCEHDRYQSLAERADETPNQTQGASLSTSPTDNATHPKPHASAARGAETDEDAQSTSICTQGSVSPATRDIQYAAPGLDQPLKASAPRPVRAVASTHEPQPRTASRSVVTGPTGGGLHISDAAAKLAAGPVLDASPSAPAHAAPQVLALPRQAPKVSC